MISIPRNHSAASVQKLFFEAVVSKGCLTMEVGVPKELMLLTCGTGEDS